MTRPVEGKFGDLETPYETLRRACSEVFYQKARPVNGESGSREYCKGEIGVYQAGIYNAFSEPGLIKIGMPVIIAGRPGFQTMELKPDNTARLQKFVDWSELTPKSLYETLSPLIKNETTSEVLHQLSALYMEGTVGFNEPTGEELDDIIASVKSLLVD